MAISRGVSTVIFSIIGIVIIVVAVVVIASVLRGEPPAKPLIYKTVELRKASDSLERAELIADIDDLVAESENDEIAEQWGKMMKCLKTSCPDEAYLDMVLVTVAGFENEIPESALLINIIATAKYWDDPEHLLDFSKALSIANEQIDAIDDRKSVKIWDEIVECNGACPEMNDLYFEIILTIVQ